ncbi:hypothetical protein UA32_12460 [Photobacterium angustum]|uniref:Uncharacterized protein n=1 Tax=Photobacterium angustum TaxID=661 RepID=A0ABX5H1D2_PHOAN|nr:hypothetical protein [Photobacterium angustum]KJG37759.1 hypothetical protein UA32_12460 [Photobacterium angustum]PSX07026.1 hypothetical protein C0W27_15775 [Photobacterium angustum]
MINKLYFLLNELVLLTRRAFDINTAGFTFMITFPLYLIGLNAPEPLMAVLSRDGAVYFVYILIYLILRANKAKSKALYRSLAVVLSILLLGFYTYLVMNRVSTDLEVSSTYNSFISISFWSLTWLGGKVIDKLNDSSNLRDH